MPDYSAVEIAQQKLELRKCMRDFAYWVDTYGYMWMKEGGDPIRFKLWEFQKDAAYKFQHEKRLIVLKARQMGLSWLVSAYTLWKVMFTTNFHAYYTSIGLKEVQEQMERIRFIFSNLPKWMQDIAYLGGRDCKDNDSLIEFTNGSAIHATASGKSAGHGSAPGLIICDEWSRVENALEKWRAINPSLGAKSQVFIISTSDGLKNHYAELWMGATSGDNGFCPIFYSAHEHPDYTEEYLENKKNEFAGDLQGYLQAFPSTPEDAFMSSSRSFFSHELIKNAKEYNLSNGIKPKFGYISEDEDNPGQYKFYEDQMGHFSLWRYPKPGHFYTMGADVALGVIGGDWSVAAVFDVETREIVGLYRAKIFPEEYSYPLLNIARYYNNAWLVVEVNTASDIIMADLKAVYPWLYRREMREKYTDLPTMIPGFYTTPTNKPRIMTNYRRQFSDKENPIRIYSDIILDEMSSFEQEEGGKSLNAAKGYHDDCVMAVALALEGETTLPYTTEWGMLRGEVGQEQRNWRSL